MSEIIVKPEYHDWDGYMETVEFYWWYTFHKVKEQNKTTDLFYEKYGIPHHINYRQIDSSIMEPIPGAIGLTFYPVALTECIGNVLYEPKIVWVGCHDPETLAMANEWMTNNPHL